MSSAGSIMSGAADAENSITNSIIQGQKMLSEQQLTAEAKRKGAWDRKMGEEEWSLKKMLAMQDYREREDAWKKKMELRNILSKGGF